MIEEPTLDQRTHPGALGGGDAALRNSRQRRVIGLALGAFQLGTVWRIQAPLPSRAGSESDRVITNPWTSSSRVHPISGSR